MIEAQTVSDDKIAWAVGILEKPQRRILDRALATRANEVLGDLRDEYPLASLFVPWTPYALKDFLSPEQYELSRQRRLTWDDVDFPQPPQEWTEFMASLTKEQLDSFCTYGYRAVWNGIRTMRGMRRLTESKRKIPMIGSTIKPFLYLAFKAHDNPGNLTLGL